jgi:hypothetical protein
VKNYDLNTAPAINVPKVGHTISGPNGIVSRSTKGIDNPRQLLARDINELRRVVFGIQKMSFMAVCFFAWKIRCYIQIMHKILYITP